MAAFRNVQILGNDTMFGTIRLIRTNGRHGYESEIVTALGDVCGVIMQHEQEKTVYIAGDTVWYVEWITLSLIISRLLSLSTPGLTALWISSSLWEKKMY